MKKIVIIDYQLSNLFSIQNACRFLGYFPVISSQKKDLAAADAAILPGVGAFGDAMDNLHKFDLVDEIKNVIKQGKPFLGICLGLQLLFSESEEFGCHQGLNVIGGCVRKIPVKNKQNKIISVPQIGWNKIYTGKKTSWEKTPLEKIPNISWMYFVHSFYVKPEKKSDIICLTSYFDFQYCSGIKRDNILGFQFHPEKSGCLGIALLQDWLKHI